MDGTTGYLLLLSVGTACLWAQGSVTIYGSVTDAGGGFVPGVAITVTHTETASERRAVTDVAGNYLVVELPVGVFSVRAQAVGFREFVQSDIRLQVNETRRIDFAMQVGEITERITVAAALTQVETRTGTISEVIDSRRITDLPLNGRNPAQLQLLMAGVGNRGGQEQQQNPTVSINGSGFRANNYVLDGGDNHDPFFNTPAPFPNPDALQEFSIETNSYGADKGRNTGIYVSAVTRSGTNGFHGSLFEFLRNKALNTRNYFAITVPPFKRNQYGATVGGPIRRNRTFFFFSYQGTKERSAPGAITATVPTAAQRQGDFSNLARTLTDPQGGMFPGNRVPASRLYQPSLRFLEAFVPLPNLPNGLLTFASDQKVDDDQRIVKVDHQLSAANRISGRLLYNFNDLYQAVATVPGMLASIKYRNWNITLGDTHVLSPTTVNSFVFTRQYISRRQLSITPGNKTWTDFGAGVVRAHAEETPAAHSTNVVGYFNAFTRFPLNQDRPFYQASDDLSLTRGGHLVKLGGEFRHATVDRIEWFLGDPGMNFNGQITGDSAADLLLGRPLSISQNSVTKWLPQGNEYALFVQDDWKVSRRFTMNLGLRWDPYTPPPDRQGAASIFKAGQKSTFFPTAPAGLVFQEDAGVPKATVKNRWMSLSPRFGFAWDPFGDAKNSVRGGYGIFFATRALQQYDGTVGPGLNLQLQINPVPGGLANPYSSIPGGNPFPFSPPSNAQERARFAFVTPIFFAPFDPDYRNGIVQQWNFNVQREILPGYLVTTAYVGAKGNHLESGYEANPGIFGLPGNLQQRRPYHPNFASIAARASNGNMTYHSMQLTLNKRLSRGFTILTNYTWAKHLDTANPIDGKDISREKAISGSQIAHRWVASYIWELPQLRNRTAMVRHVFGGWETNGIFTLESGLYFSVTSGRDNSGTGINSDRPDLIGNPRLPTDRPRGELILKYFEPTAFRQNDPGTFGTVGRNLLAGPGEANVDFGVVKNISVRESHRVQFRAEFFNLFNRVNLANPNGNLANATVGRITSAGDPRVIQMALKYVF